MLFSSIIFLFGFLPLTLALYALCPARFKNSLLLVMSLIFYAWGEVRFVLLMLSMVAVNYAGGILLAKANQSAKLILSLAIAINLGVLAYFKCANFFVENINAAALSLGLPTLPYAHVMLPLGISFYIFQSISYLIDVYRDRSLTQKNPINLGLYIALFPQLVAGPIVRYHDVMDQIRSRRVQLAGFTIGVERFIIGLAKKLLIANTMGSVADSIFALNAAELSWSVAWLGIICYTAQIYFDFSGYSDMAIGLGRMFGFEFLENFNYPYISKSITEFWRRWHISLSNWFRDYLYIPLGGNRVSPLRMYFNLTVVFFLCGLWHGASWNFVIWGLFHGALLVIEKLCGVKPGVAGFSFFKHVYVLLLVMIGWVFFRAETLEQATQYLMAMAGLGSASTGTAADYFTPLLGITLVAAVIGSTPWVHAVKGWLDNVQQRLAEQGGWAAAMTHCRGITGTVVQATLLLACALTLSAATYNPFIYFRF
jgi:alginate O-acetyltransferase complex protein AlgI